MNEKDLLNNPNLKNIDPAKLQMLLSMADQSAGKKQNELLPFIMAMTSKSKSDGVNFSGDETDAIIEVLKAGKSPEEIQNIERIRTMMKLMK